MSKHYVSSKEKYKDNHESAICLLIVGIIGFIFIILVNTGVINISLSATTRIFETIVLSIIFGAFTIFGIVCLFSSKKFKAQIGEDDNIKDNLIKYIDEKKYISNISAFVLSESDSDSLTDEELYILRTEKLQEIIFKEFPDINSTLVEEVIDDKYEEIFE